MGWRKNDPNLTNDPRYLEPKIEDVNRQLAETASELNFDFANRKPTFLNSFKLSRNSVMQCHFIKKEHVYITQVGGSAEYSGHSAESYTINRFTLGGKFLDTMVLNHGGHGEGVVPEVENGELYIWSPYEKVDANGASTGSDLVRFKYVPNAVYNEKSPELTRFNKFNNNLTLPSVDNKNGLIALVIRINSSSYKAELRNLSEFKQGINSVMSTVIINGVTYPDLMSPQGFALDGDTLYLYSGDLDGVAHPMSMASFSFTTGSMIQSVHLDFGKNNQGRYEGDSFEPEGAFFYKDPKTGAKSLFVGLATGQESSGVRYNHIYGFHSINNESKFAGDSLQWAQRYKFSESNGESLSTPTGRTKLADITEPGAYYFTTPRSLEFSDMPSGMAGVSGFWLDVSPIAGTRVRQKLTRNTTSNTLGVVYERIVDANSGIASSWQNYVLVKDLSWADMPVYGGAVNPDSQDKFQFAVSGGYLHLRGKLSIPLTNPIEFASLPVGIAPKKNWYMPQIASGTAGFRKIVIMSNGRIEAHGLVSISGETVDFYHMNAMIPQN